MPIEKWEALKAAAGKAAHGPWAYQEESDAYTHIVRQGVHPNIHGWICSAGQSSSQSTEDTARFIAAASPETILTLLSTLSATQRELEEARSDIEDRKAASKYSSDVDDEVAHALGVPLCEIHQKYCAPRVAYWLIENKKKTDAAAAEIATLKARESAASAFIRGQQVMRQSCLDEIVDEMKPDLQELVSAIRENLAEIELYHYIAPTAEEETNP